MNLDAVVEDIVHRARASYNAFYLSGPDADDVDLAWKQVTEELGVSEAQCAEWSYAYGCVRRPGDYASSIEMDGSTDKSLSSAVEKWLSNLEMANDASVLANRLIRDATKAVEQSKGKSPIERALELKKLLEVKVSRIASKCVRVYLVRDVHLIFESACRGDASANKEIAALKLFISSLHATPSSSGEHTVVFLLGLRTQMPPTIESCVTMYDVDLPDLAEIEEIVRDSDFGKAVNGLKTKDKKKASRILDGVIKNLKGLSRRSIMLLLKRLHLDHDPSLIYQEKKQEIQKSGVLKLIETDLSLSDIGGLVDLVEWLRRRGKILERMDAAEGMGVDTPKGVLIVGVPGCGKTLTAKVVAKIFGVQLLRLDMGSLMGKYVGESEENMRRALALAASASPCVLWIDEIEKAFAGVSNQGVNSEIATRLFGYFLTWLQEKKEFVFVVATANRMDLPPELFRRGRFDEVFYVDFPTEEEAKAILEVHLRKRLGSVCEDRVDWSQIAEDAIGNLFAEVEEPVYSGSDIEALAATAVERLFLSDVDVRQDDFAEALRSELDQIIFEKVIRPLGETMKDELAANREKIKKMGLRSASGRAV